ncbi:MAG: type IIL restriction-modification enzyme MmeI [Akkermansiaceae bacterium]
MPMDRPAAPAPSAEALDTFISKWAASGAAERANYNSFLNDLCDLLGVARPDPTQEKTELNNYVFDRSFTKTDKDGETSPVYLDLYKRGHFVLETKQGSSGEGDKVGHGKRGSKTWDKALEKAHAQALDYIRTIPADHRRPPFLIVCDVGHCFDI